MTECPWCGEPVERVLTRVIWNKIEQKSEPYTWCDSCHEDNTDEDGEIAV